MASDRKIVVGGNVTGSAVQAGDHNQADVFFQQATLPPPESVDIKAELQALRSFLMRLDSADRRKIDNALSDAEDEVSKPKPDKKEVGTALERALGYAKKAADFTKVVNDLAPHMSRVASWLGENWHHLLSFGTGSG